MKMFLFASALSEEYNYGFRLAIYANSGRIRRAVTKVTLSKLQGKPK